MATSSVVSSSTRRGWSGHVTVSSRAAKSRIPNIKSGQVLTRPGQALCYSAGMPNLAGGGRASRKDGTSITLSGDVRLMLAAGVDAKRN
jgi:hypothetical protein